MTKTEFQEIIKYVHEIIVGSVFDGHVYAVGGSVRDMVMGNEIKDIDMCVDLPDGGLKFAKWLEEQGYTTGSVVTYPTYGTAMFHFSKYPNEEIECVQTRGEQYHDKNSRNPVVTFASLAEDCVRRDLTMNALYYDVTTFEVVDLTGKGIADINQKLCRVTNDNPDNVFQEDPLRILRVIRFVVRYGFEIEENTYKSMCDNVDRLDIITTERINAEFSKMMIDNDSVRALKLIREIGAMKYIIPELEETYEMGQNAYHFGTVWEHTLKAVECCFKQNDLTLKLACLLHDIGKIAVRSVGEDGRVHFYDHETVGSEMARTILTRLKYPNALINEVCFYIKWHMSTKQWGDDCNKMKLKSLRKLEYTCKTYDRMANLMIVIDADNKAHAPEHCMKAQCTKIMATVQEQIIVGSSMFDYKLPINGEDVMNELNIEAGPNIKQYLKHCMNLAYKNPRITKEECLRHIRHDIVKDVK